MLKKIEKDIVKKEEVYLERNQIAHLEMKSILTEMIERKSCSVFPLLSNLAVRTQSYEAVSSGLVSASL